MKKQILLTTLISATLFCNAQIKVFSGGLNSYGTTTMPPANTKHLFGGNVRFDNWTDVILDWNSGACCSQPALYPENDWYFQLGTPSKFLGDAFINHIFTRVGVSFLSDKNCKKNISYNLGTLQKIKQLKPATYNFNDKVAPAAPKHIQDKISACKEYGFIAQDLEKVFPELVEKDSITGLYAVKYIEFIPIIVDAIKQQQEKIDSLSMQLNTCCQKNNGNKRLSNVNNITTNNQESYLLQNNPNPYSTSTIIEYNVISQNISSAIMIFDMNGKLLKTYSIKEQGKGQLSINAKELFAGLYYYSLLVDGQEIDTKKMIITE